MQKTILSLLLIKLIITSNILFSMYNQQKERLYVTHDLKLSFYNMMRKPAKDRNLDMFNILNDWHTKYVNMQFPQQNSWLLLMEHLIWKINFDTKARDRMGNTLLMQAINLRCPSALIKLFIEKGVSLSAKNNSDDTALSCAEKIGYKDIITLIKDYKG